MQIHYLTLEKVHIGNFIVLKHFFFLFLMIFLIILIIIIIIYNPIQLILLELSAAFDTIDHSILIKCLEDIGIVGIPQAWVKSYLSERTFSITIDYHYSSTCKMYYGRPKGSALVLLLFSLYI